MMRVKKMSWCDVLHLKLLQLSQQLPGNLSQSITQIC